ncbi:MAG: hypothetical protein ABIG61_02800 [Planctomycetota bacterium]
MVNRFFEENRTLLKFYISAAKLIGWILFVLGLIALTIIVIEVLRLNFGYAERIDLSGPTGEFERSYAVLILTGLVAICLSQFLRLLIEADSAKPWLLRNCSKLLFVYLVYLIIQGGGYFWMRLSNLLGAIRIGSESSNEVTGIAHQEYGYFLLVVITAVFCIGKVLCVFGLAQFIKRILPIIEESRTLV